MNTADIILIVIIAAAVLIALRSIIKRYKKGGCGCGCEGCTGCKNHKQ